MSGPVEGIDLRRRRVLVTGGAGFIGSHLVEALLDLDCRVRVLDDLSTGNADNLPSDAAELTLLEGDIRDCGVCRRAMMDVDLVFHQAALGSVPRSVEDPLTTLEVNLQGTANVLEAARHAGAKRVVYASSSSVYGSSETLPKREGEEGRPLSPYAASKLFCEELAEVFGRTYGLETIGLRYFNIYGPRQSPEGPYAAVIPRFFRAAVTDSPLEVCGDGRQTRDFTAVADAVAANLLAARAPADACGRVFNVAAGRQTSIDELAQAIGALVGEAAEVTHGPPRPGDVRHSLADLERARHHLGYEPRVGIEAGLALCLDYYRTLFGSPAGRVTSGS